VAQRRLGPPRFLRIIDHTQRRTSVDRTPLDDWLARRRDLYLTTQHSQEINISAPSGIRFHNPSKRAAADPRLRPRGHWNRPPLKTGSFYFPSSHQIVLNFQIWFSIVLYISQFSVQLPNFFHCFCQRCAVCVSDIFVIIHYWSFVLKLLHFERFWRPSSSGKWGDLGCWIRWRYWVSITRLKGIH